MQYFSVSVDTCVVVGMEINGALAWRQEGSPYCGCESLVN